MTQDKDKFSLSILGNVEDFDEDEDEEEEEEDDDEEEDEGVDE